MVLSDKEIRQEITEGNIILFDPDRDCSSNIQNCSVDITLGNYYFRNSKRIERYNPWCEEHVKEYWGDVQTATVVHCEVEANAVKLPVGYSYIRMEPGESILSHTREFVGGRNKITTMIKARSSLGRSNITICRDAGWGDINYVNRWTLEITNNGTSPVILPVGARIGQIIFFYTGTPQSPYMGKYQPLIDDTDDSISNMVNTWNPNMLLPQLYREKISL